ncbi:MAG: hypothetical protein IPK13_22310 [Deltaproteobacteria bacterium]|nr:hypothetical protein [Deltaproteobacteria bacterium]
MTGEIQVWSVFDRDDRLVLALSNEPGEYNFARLPPRPVDPVFLPYATVQCYDAKAESALLQMVMASSTVSDLFQRLSGAGYRIQLGRPKTGHFARL